MVVAEENMSDFNQMYLSALHNVTWVDPSEFTFANEQQKQWLLAQDSLSRRLESCCQSLTVSLLENETVAASTLNTQELSLVGSTDCLRRQVILHGDDSPWVFGRTLIPTSSLIDQKYDLARQGNIPLGLTVFSVKNTRRDALQVGSIETAVGRLLARRSRLWMNEKPMLVAELFLPLSPVYTVESIDDNE